MSQINDADVQWRKAHEHANALPAVEFPYDSKYVEVNGHRIHYVESGNLDGDPIVFIHGAPTSVYRLVTQGEMMAYREPFFDVSKRGPLLQMPRDVPLDGQPADLH